MKIYVAGPWIHRDKAKEFANKLEATGHEITRDWWNHEAEGDQYSTLAEHAMADGNAVIACDTLVLLNSAKSEGKATELGIALALNKQVIIVGESDSNNIFYNLKTVIKTSDLESTIVALKELEENA